MISSQSSAQSVASLSGATETETKRIVPHRGSASGFDPPRSSPEAEPRLLKKNPTERKYNFLPTGEGVIREYWPVIFAIALTDPDDRGQSSVSVMRQLTSFTPHPNHA